MNKESSKLHPKSSGHTCMPYWQAEENEPRNNWIFLTEERRKSHGLKGQLAWPLINPE